MPRLLCSASNALHRNELPSGALIYLQNHLEWRALSRERDPEMFYQGLFQLGQRLESDHRDEAAQAVYASIGDKAPAEVQRRACERLQALNGSGGIGAQAESFLRHLTGPETLQAPALLGLTSTLIAGKVLRLATLNRLRLSPAVNALTRGLGAQGLAGGAALLGEIAVLPVATRLGALAVGEELSWDLSQLGKEALGSALFLGGMRLMSGGVYGARYALGERGLALNNGPIRQASVLGGIALGQHFEETAGLRGPSDGAGKLFSALQAYQQLFISGEIAGGVLGRGFAKLQRSLDSYVDEIGRSASRSGETAPEQWQSAFAAAGNIESIPGKTLASPFSESNYFMAAEKRSRSRSARYPLHPVLTQVKDLPHPKAVSQALRRIYTGIVGPLRARVFYSIDALEGGASPDVVLSALFEGPALGKTVFLTEGIRNQTQTLMERLARGEATDFMEPTAPLAISAAAPTSAAPRTQKYEHLSSEEVVRLNLERAETIVRALRGTEQPLPLPAAQLLQELLGLQAYLNGVTRRIMLQADIDTLTGVSNRSYWERQIPELQRRLLGQRNVSRSDWVLMIDIDYFKKVNDTYGHTPNGDEALWTVAQTITRVLRPQPRDIVARFGGEEFVVYLFNSGQEGAQTVAENIRRAVEATDIEIKEIPDVTSIRVTVSVGGAEMRLLPPAQSPGKLSAEGAVEDAMRRADQHLYHAKESGRNRVHIPKTS